MRPLVLFIMFAPCLRFLTQRSRKADARTCVFLKTASFKIMYNLFSVEIYKLHGASTIIMALLVLSRLEVLRRVCAVIFLVNVYSLSHNRHG